MAEMRRRALLAGLAALGALPAAAAVTIVAEPPAESIAPADPWRGRELKSGERELVRQAGKAMAWAVNDDRLDTGLMDNHYRIRMPAHLLFSPGKDALTHSGIDMLTGMASGLARHPKVRVEIVSHHHASAHSYNDFILTERRSEAIRGLFGSRGIEIGRLKATGLGSRFPLGSNHDEQGRTLNRRVEILIRPL